MLSLMLEDEASFTQYKDHLLSAQEPQTHVKLKDALMRNSWPTSLEVYVATMPIANERFLQKVTAFRLIVRILLTLLVKFVHFSIFGSP